MAYLRRPAKDISFASIMMRPQAFLFLLLPVLLAASLWPLWGLSAGVWSLRSIRLLNCLCAGGALSLAGLLFQHITRNPLADPYLSGVAPAALLGQLLGIILGYEAQTLFPLSASIVIAGAVAGVSLLNIRKSRTTMLLTGILLGSLCVTASQLLTYLFPTDAVIKAVSFQTLSTLDLPDTRFAIPAIALSLAAAALLDTRLRGSVLSLTFSTDKAHSLGLNTAAWSVGLLLLASMLTSLTTVSFGLIGFVGFLVPNLLRLTLGAGGRYRHLLAVVLGGL